MNYWEVLLGKRLVFTPLEDRLKDVGTWQKN